MTDSARVPTRVVLLACGIVFVAWHLLANQPSRHPANGKELCIVADRELTESSGMAISHATPELIWLHNDSGDSARLFLIARDGETRAIVTLNGIDPVDWEDMCSFSVDGTNWLLIADIGDNGRIRSAKSRPCQLLLVKEPVLENGKGDQKKAKVQKLKADVFTTIQISYPDGPVDCESIAVDTVRREILFVTKTDPVNCRLLRTPLLLTDGRHNVTLEEIGKPGVPYATAMDISPDGRRMLIGSMFLGALLERSEGESWQDAAGRSPGILQLPGRRQGETACFDSDASFVLVGSEGVQQPIWRVPATLPVDQSK